MEDALPAGWERSLARLQQFAAEHQRLPKCRERYQGHKLGAWCHRQRQARKRDGTRPPLSAAQVRALEAVPGWEWGAAPKTWGQVCSLLAEYAAEHQQMPPRRTVYQGVKLGVWCHNQRQNCKGRGTHRQLTAAQARALSAVPGWWWHTV